MTPLHLQIKATAARSVLGLIKLFCCSIHLDIYYILFFSSISKRLKHYPCFNCLPCFNFSADSSINFVHKTYCKLINSLRSRGFIFIIKHYIRMYFWSDSCVLREHPTRHGGISWSASHP